MTPQVLQRVKRELDGSHVPIAAMDLWNRLRLPREVVYEALVHLHDREQAHIRPRTDTNGHRFDWEAA